MGRESRASQAEAEIAPFLLTLPVTKVDQANWLVTGVVTSETVDHQGEIVDYAAAKALFTDADSWPGNIREMHKADAVGKRVSVECDDVTKTISLTAKVSKGAPQTWAKVLDGTLSMYSLGGKAAKRVVEKSATGTTATRMFLGQLVEVSLVDHAANPVAKFDIVKSVNGVLVDAQPAEPDPIASAEAALTDAVAKATPPPKNKTASGKVGTHYAGTDGRSFPITDPIDVDHAARALGETTQNRADVKTNIIKIAYEMGKAYVAQLPNAWKKAADQTAKVAHPGDVVKAGMEPYDIDQALSAIGFINRLMASEYWEARMAASADGNKDGPEVAQVAMLKAACDALLKFLQSEYFEQFAPAPKPAGSPDIDSDDLEAALVSADDVVELFTKSLVLVQKSGARHNKTDTDMIQQTHDLTVGLGATCPTPADPGAEKVQKAKGKGGLPCPKCDGSGDCPTCDGTGTMSTSKKSVDGDAPDETVQKLTAELETTKAQLVEHQATVAETAKTIATLSGRLKTIEDLPMPGGPMKTAMAVDKTIGGGPPGPERGSEQAVTDALQKLIDDNPRNELIRTEVAKALLSRQFATGANRLIFETPQE